MSEKPIIFSGQMVRAILDGNKTMTRRVINPQPESISDAKKPKYQVGDILWVRETFRPKGFERKVKEDITYKADCDTRIDRWKPSIFMPKWASRIKLRVTSVKVQRVQDISDEDAKAEGVNKDIRPNGIGLTQKLLIENKLIFVSLWNSINSKRGYSWYSNPFVFVYTFEVIGNKANG